LKGHDFSRAANFPINLWALAPEGRYLRDIFWIPIPDKPDKKLVAIVLRPRGGEWLEDELIRMKEGGIETLVSMLEAEEAQELGLTEEGPIAKKVGLNFFSYPIKDRNLPENLTNFSKFIDTIIQNIKNATAVGIHCRGSIGRATITTACVLIKLGCTPITALEFIECARGCFVPDTQEQREWILNYER
jgi:protein-tyrosine phosphatase